MSSHPPDNQSSGGFKAFLQRTRQTLASFSPLAAKPKISCPLAKPAIVEDAPLEVVLPQRKARVRPESTKEPEPWRLTVLVKCVDRQGRDTKQVPQKTVQVSLTADGGSVQSLSIEKDDFVGGIGQTKYPRGGSMMFRRPATRCTKCLRRLKNGRWLHRRT